MAMKNKSGKGKNGKSQGASSHKSGGKSGDENPGKTVLRSAAKSSRTSPQRMEARPAAGGGDTSDAFDVLKAQHREVESLFKQFERAENDNESFEVAQLICQKLTVHATIEEEIVYPLARKRGEDGEMKEMVLEAAEEHLSAKRLIADIQAVEVGDETLGAKISVLKEQISHHVDEEEDELFPQMKRVVPKEERRSIGRQLAQRTEELEAEEDTTTVYRVGSSENADQSESADGSLDAGVQKPEDGRSHRSTSLNHH